MSECQRIGGYLFDVYEKKADNQTEKLFFDHLRKCPCCNKEFQWYGRTVGSLTKLDEIAPPANFMRQLNVRLDDAESKSFFEFFRRMFSSAPFMPAPVGVAALAVIAVLGFVLYNQSIPGAAPGLNQQPLAGETHKAAAKKLANAGPGDAMHAATVMRSKGVVDNSANSPLMAPSSSLPRYSMATHNTMPTANEFGSPPRLGSAFPPTLADQIGADNLTVESHSVSSAVESIKRILPHLRGKLVEVKPSAGRREVVLGVVIPSEAYGELAGELINFGAVEAGAGSHVTPPTRAKDGAKNVYLHIRFLNTP